MDGIRLIFRENLSGRIGNGRNAVAMGRRIFFTICVFVLATILGYLAILFGWITITELADINDREGAMIMGVAFFFAPVGGLVLGLVAACAAHYRLRK